MQPNVLTSDVRVEDTLSKAMGLTLKAIEKLYLGHVARSQYKIVRKAV